MPDHIRIGDVRPRVQYIADGALSAFDYPFPIFESEDLSVFLDDTEQRAGYTVNGAGRSRGGSVSFDDPPAHGVRVTLQRILAVERTTDFQEGGAFRADTINDELDRQTAMIQQIADETARALTAAPTDPTVALSLPPKDKRAGRYLAFDADGNAVAAGGGPAATPVSPFAAGLLADGDAAAIRKTLGLGGLATRSAIGETDLAAQINPLGSHTVWVPAGSMTGETGREPEPLVRKLTGGLMVSALEFHVLSPRYAQFALAMPKGWDAGNLKLRLFWTAESGSGTVRWGVQAAAIGNDRPLDATFSAAVAVQDWLIARNDLHETAESAAITPSGFLATAGLVQLRIYRDTAHSKDTLTAAAQLLGVRIRYGIDAANDD